MGQWGRCSIYRHRLHGQINDDDDDDDDDNISTCSLTLHVHIDTYCSPLARPPSSQWHRRTSRPRNRWVDQIRNENNLPPVNLWRHAVNRGHRGATRRYGPCRLSDDNNNNNSTLSFKYFTVTIFQSVPLSSIMLLHHLPVCCTLFAVFLWVTGQSLIQMLTWLKVMGGRS